MIGLVNGDKSGARHAGDERDDEPSPSGIVWSLSQEYEARVAKWAQITVKQTQDYERAQRSDRRGDRCVLFSRCSRGGLLGLLERMPDFVVYANTPRGIVTRSSRGLLRCGRYLTWVAFPRQSETVVYRGRVERRSGWAV